jgi:hypothetical protein
MNHNQVVDHELRLFNQFKAEGKRLLHFCPDWDDMAIHAEMDEISCCCCDFNTEADNELRDQKAEEVNQRRAKEEYQKPIQVAPGVVIVRETNFSEIFPVAYEDRLTDKNITRIFSSDGAPAHSGTEVATAEEAAEENRPQSSPKALWDYLKSLEARIAKLEEKPNAET